jgi:transcriptional regulator with XRE-family HTH domain
MTQRQLAQKTGLSHSLISHMETGRDNLSVITAILLLKALTDPPEVYVSIKQRALSFLELSQ